ncbi:hypothetical protein J5Y09_11560 [Roseomonas sp. PWR1]|uniref:Uncharacterized protein n=1 Tax=Roseomonas nitratireducens TaxID=2820810 RepID=A0ABS4AT56_9PROT|nr:hypothetical protein [Neoroseomonas nitratireducens]MBP0464544.1 hypothetical protein [Neoroseomonas nitratireducens]
MGDTITPSRVPAVLRGFGAALLAVGLAGYVLPPPPVHWTALIPAGLGAAALLLSFAGRRPRLAAAGGALLCAVAFAGGGSALAQVPALLDGQAGAAIASRAATAALAILALAGLVLALRRDTRGASA